MICVPAMAGGGPQNVLVIYNSQISWSQSIALHYQAARNIPSDNMLALSITLSNLSVSQPPTSHRLASYGSPGSDDDNMLMMTVTEFTNSIYNPIVNYLKQKSLTNQVYILVICEGIPWRTWPNISESTAATVNNSEGFDANWNVIGSEAHVDTAYGRFILGNAPPVGCSGNPGYTTYYGTNEAFKLNNWSVPTYTSSGYSTGNKIPFLVSMLYGYFAGDYLHGQNLVNDAVDRAVAGDATYDVYYPYGCRQQVGVPTHQICSQPCTFLFLDSDDNLRNGRSPYFWIEAETLRQEGLGAICDKLCVATSSLYQPWLNPGFTGSVMGITMGSQQIPEPNVTGTTAYVWSSAHGWPWANGAYGETLTSFGGLFLGSYQDGRGQIYNWHTTPECFMAAGGIGGYGTGKEPHAINEKFPLPLQFRRYAEGFSYVEVMYQSIADISDATVVGDPLSAPFAKRPSVDVSGLPAQVNQGDQLVVSINATPCNQGGAVQRLEAYVDGHFVASYVPSCPADQTVSVTISGATVSYTTTGGETRGAILSQIQNTINNSLSGSVVAVGKDLGWYYQFNNLSSITQVQPQAGTGNQTSGQLMLLTQARGFPGNGISTTASGTNGSGANFVHPYWLAPATYGGAQWDGIVAHDHLAVTVSQRLVAPGGESLTVEFISSDGLFTNSGVVTISENMGTNDIAHALAQEMGAISGGQYESIGNILYWINCSESGATFTVHHDDCAASGFVVELSDYDYFGDSWDDWSAPISENSSGDLIFTDNTPQEDWSISAGEIKVSVVQKAFSQLVSPSSDVLTVQFHSSDDVTSGTGSVNLSTATSSADAACMTASCMAMASCGQYQFFQSGNIYEIQATGSTPASTFIINQSGSDTSWFEIGLRSFSADSSGNIVGQTSGGGPGLNYLYLDMGWDNLTKTFSFDTTSLSPTTHTLMIVAFDGGAAEAQGYWSGSFTVSGNWVYQNPPPDQTDTTEAWLEREFFVLAPEGWPAELYTLFVFESGPGVVYLSETPSYSPGLSTSYLCYSVSGEPGSYLTFWAIGSTMSNNGWGVGACVLTVSLTAPPDYTNSEGVTIEVRLLGDINGDGMVDGDDLDILNERLNGFEITPCTDEDCELCANPYVTTADRVRLRKILNGVFTQSP